MPEIKIKHVTSFSSEDKVHKAENILLSETYRKWKCATPGEKNASVVLQFEKATQIHSIDIGNESSAFVEVLVGRSSDSVKDYQVLLSASSFMSPLESRNETHNNRVRMFDNEKLAQNLKDEKWDSVQVVCTQPFNKNITYGLCFIKFRSPPEKFSEQQPPVETKTATTKLGAFELKFEDEDEIESSPPVGTSWLKNKNSTTNSPSSSQESPSYAAAVLASTSDSNPEAKKGFAGAVNELKEKSDSEKKRSPKVALPLREKNKRLNVPKVNPFGSDSDEEVNTRSSKKRESATPQASTSHHPVKVDKKRPFHKILDKVVFVLSGFVNPLRGDLRDKAIEMGAKYKGDWDATCTHLVCAFLNTPKYLQVRGAGGKIVKKEWIIDCHKKKTLLPWKSYMLGKYSKTSSEESDGSEAETSSARKGTAKTNGHNSNSQNPTKKRRAMIASDSDSDEETPPAPTHKKPRSLFGDVTENDKPKPAVKKQEEIKPVVSKDGSETEDEEALKDYIADTDVESDSGNDTEDEIRKVEEAAKRKKQAQKDVSSDGEDSDSLLSPKPDIVNLPLPELPNLFKKRHFYLYGEFSSKTRHDLQRFITAYNGIVEDYMNDTIKYVVTEQGWDKNFEDALEENEDLIFVKPTWIFKCHETQKLVPYQAYIVIPT
ncbi:hypothetical protein JTE90_021372 [Oedothorax gibbosus]|uniref:DNA repair protein XRCC1 n=1 Tax=Oedothorax gibbosus TaxID=931172 RepID=A0AAV6VGT5_9ARAC|nr:hypothetical protein JTE90_021372 [Oedothorax gibbosus]